MKTNKSSDTHKNINYPTSTPGNKVVKKSEKYTRSRGKKWDHSISIDTEIYTGCFCDNRAKTHGIGIRSR